MSFVPRVLVTLLLAAALAGCANRNAHDLFPPVAVQAPQASVERVFVATTRAPSSDPKIVFSGQRSRTESFASVGISIPPDHKIGVIERPRGKTRDPQKYFTARSFAPIGTAGEFLNSVAAAARQDGGRALVFVHGYNTNFDSAVYRASQIVHDAGYAGAPVLFSWASSGRVVDYVYDRDSANAARDSLEGLLRGLAKSGVKRIDVIAHSMGTWLTMEALRGLAISGDRDLGGRLGDVVLASPDIDVDVFRTQMKRYGKPDRPFTVLLSGDDRALRFSSLIAGQQPRLGEYKDAADIAELGVVVVDLTRIKSGDSLNHAKFADNPALVTLLGESLRRGDELSGERDLDDTISLLLRGAGHTLGGAADIIITTPGAVISAALGGG